MNSQLKSLIAEMASQAQADRAEVSAYFFKTAPGQYGEGDKFIGLTVPQSRLIAKRYKDLSKTSIRSLLKSPVHEHRLVSLLILVDQYQVGSQLEQQTIFEFYLNNTDRVNNWDLVDSSAYQIAGHFLFNKPKNILSKLAKSSSLWERRISIVSTYYFISNNQFAETLLIAKLLLKDKEDLIHKAVGWMLREVGKRSTADLFGFLNKNYRNMPRTMLRYAIEKFPEPQRQAYLKGQVD